MPANDEYAFAQCYILRHNGLLVNNEVMIKEAILKNNIDNAEKLFTNQTMLEKVQLPDDTLTLPSELFMNCTLLTNIIIPDSVTSIASFVFKNCINLTNIYIPNSVITCSASSFRDCINLTNIYVSEENVNYKTINGNLYSKDGTKLVIYAPGHNEFDISSSTTTISNSAFSYNNKLTSIKIPNSVITLQNFAFSDCSNLIKVDFSEHTVIPTCDVNTFIRCSSSLKFVVPDDLYDDWIVATNWVSNASKIVKASEVTE